MDFLVARDDLHRCRFDTTVEPELEAGQALLGVDAFGLTSNNITYVMFGEAMSYWNFFPAPQGWGRVPVWGFADVIASREPRLPEGTRVYGYLPPSEQLLVVPEKVGEQGFTDASPHRSELPQAYNRYLQVNADPVYEADQEDRQMLLRPLYFTSYLIDDFLCDSEDFGAEAIVLSSASSRTASALAFLLSRRGGIDVVGLTSARGVEFTRALGVYDHVIDYDQLEELPQGRAVYVDISGDAAVRSAIHGHYRDELMHSAVVGATHHDKLAGLPEALPGPHPKFFFAPDRVLKRTADWGLETFEARLAEVWRPYLQWTTDWLEVIHERGPQALERTYLNLLDGRIDPAKAHVLSLS